MSLKKSGVLILSLLIVAGMIQAREMEPVDENLVRIYKTVRGPDEAQVIKEVSIEAVRKCVGRIYLETQLIIARDLLEKYIAQNYDKFVYSIETVNKNYIGDDIELELNIFVKYAELAQDLKEKRFMYKPRYKPYFGIFIKETLNGQPSSVLTAQEEVMTVLKDRAARFPEMTILYPPSNVDLTEDSEILAAAMKEAHKAGVELIISGSSETYQVKKEQLYYDVFYFYETKINLSLIRADTGDILYEDSAVHMCYDTDERTAIDRCIMLAAHEVANDIIDFYYDVWDKIFLNDVDYQVMVTGIQDEALYLLKQKLEGLESGTEVYVRSFYQNVAVLNLVFPGEPEDIEKVVKTSAFPTYRILEMTDNYLEAQKEY